MGSAQFSRYLSGLLNLWPFTFVSLNHAFYENRNYVYFNLVYLTVHVIEMTKYILVQWECNVDVNSC